MSPMSPRLLRPRASGSFDPRSVSGIAFWLDARATNTITLDGSNNVSTWADKTTNARNATQTTAANRPTLNSLGFGGKQAIRFLGGLDEALSLGDLSAVFPTAGEVFIAVDLNGDNFYSLYATRANSEHFVFSNGASFFGTFALARQSGVSASAPSTGRRVVSIRCSSGGNQVVRVDGSQIFSGAPVSGYAAGNAHTIGNNPNPSAGGSLSGWIGEVIAYSTLPSAADRSKIERYLGSKWGVTVA